MNPSLSNIPFVSIYTYNPHQNDKVGVILRDSVTAVKQDGFLPLNKKNVPVIPHLISMMAEKKELYSFISNVFTANCALVPVPGHSEERKSKTSESTRSTERICEQIIQTMGFGITFRALSRTKTVAKAAWTKSGERLKWREHYNTIAAVEPSLSLGITSLVLVDDVITSGSTMYGAYKRLQEAFPRLPITCFSLIRAQNDANVSKFSESPVTGVIEVNGEQTIRRP